MEITKVERINSIIIAAFEEFIEKGYDQTSMNNIAERANLSKGGLYHHFFNKEELLFSVNSYMMQPIVNLMRKAELYDSPLEGIKYFINGYFNFWIEHKKELEINLIVISKLVQSKKGKENYKEYINSMKTFFEFMFVKAIELKEIKNCNINLISSLLFTILEGNLIKIATNSLISSNELLQEIESVILENLQIKLGWF
ncbi:MAG TPA: TetR/AcrR family transcriptional regulator [Melioribacteraceae bacterium]|nr:TetR/AcrR family transcriptional regulator [Melioribacteraceae bacterium]